MKNLVALIILAALTHSLNAQTLPLNKANGKVTYRFTVEVPSHSSRDEMYRIASEWFNRHAAELSRSNKVLQSQGVNQSRLAEVEHEFNNQMPVQSLDPASNRMTIKVVSKYFGQTGGTIHALYLQYYMVLTVNENSISCELSNFSYNHFNERSFQFKRIQNWGNSTSLEPVGTLEYLAENQQSSAEFAAFFGFMNKDLNTLMAQFSKGINGSGVIAMN